MQESKEFEFLIDVTQVLKFLRKIARFIIAGSIAGLIFGYILYLKAPKAYKIIAYVKFLGNKGVSVDNTGNIAENPLVGPNTAVLLIKNTMRQIIEDLPKGTVIDYNVSTPYKGSYPLAISIIIRDIDLGNQVIQKTMASANDSRFVKEAISIYSTSLDTAKKRYDKYFKEASTLYSKGTIETKHAYLNIMYNISNQMIDLNIKTKSIKGFELITDPEIDNNGRPVLPFLPFYLLGGIALGILTGIGVGWIYTRRA